jgi:AcrR family transcriptional regulator
VNLGDVDIHQVETTKTKIFNIAARLMAQKGYNTVTMRQISEQSGVSKPTIYYYFKSKEGLYQELINTGLAYVDSQVDEIFTRDIPVKHKLTELVKIRFHQCLNYPDFAKFFLYLFAMMEDTPLPVGFKKEAITRREFLVDLIQEGINNGEFGLSVKTSVAVEIIIGTLTHFISQQLSTKKVILSDQLAEEVIEVLFKGLNE